MSDPGIVTWLQERTALSLCPQEVLEALAPHLETRIIPIYQNVAIEDSAPDGLYILRSGLLESNSKRLSPVGLLPGSVINLQALILKQPVQATITTLSDCEFWWINAAEFSKIIAQYPEITQIYSQKLAATVEELSSQLNFEQQRQTILRPYLVSKAKRGVIGKTRYAVRLRAEIKKAAASREPVLIFGEPGLEKDNLAALIHFGSPFRRQPIIKIDCSKLQISGADLFGRAGGKMGLIEALGEGTLVLNNLQELPKELFNGISELLQEQTYTPISRKEDATPTKKLSQARIIFISERTVPEIDPLVPLKIKVPPLRVRKADLDEWLNYYLALICRGKGINKPQVTPEAIRRLQAYDFPNNLRELESLAQRAIVQLQGTTVITEEIIWPSASKKKLFRLNLLNVYPALRRFLRSPWYPDRINYGFTAAAFALVVGILFLGPQTRQENFALNLFWAWWWPLVLIGFPFVGRLWCAFCPFMIYGEITQKLSLWLFKGTLKKWPRQAAEHWGGWFLFGLFTLILLWEELWNLQNTAYLSACLLLLITAGAMIFSAIFERRFWCRYLCPIGGMNGMFAKLSMTELRAQQGTCSAECTTYQCYKGGPAKGEGQETGGCPLYSHPAQLEDNRDCVLCMTCLKACPHRSVEFNLRPPGIELWTTHVQRPDEVALMLLLFGAVFLHHLAEIQALFQVQWNLSEFWLHLGLSVAALSLPALVVLMAYGLRSLSFQITQMLKPRPFFELAYGYLPLVLAANLAHYWRLGLGEAGRILPVTLATFGLKGSHLPILVAHPAVIAFLQGSTLILGIMFSIFLTQKIARQPFFTLLTQHLSIVFLGMCLGKIVVGY
ncbi:sigma 54-interacting transcriptional regulator [Gloeothece verrucosa]|uniref:Cyclic nucleotide-binding protein n=1 Tax=Gloeothece verrucosa (strain PCC 7822) TaxID=497965 RepID=E0UAS0_GLOV7|nr:sigma 54-interacting transcriptional regulator [Gloeothece verrucosa]ADN13922.1 cyclic nucleotide-binding protein [Gloeothece verrucosa PCC 7822]